MLRSSTKSPRVSNLIEEKLGPPSILISNAASPIHGRPLLEESEKSVLTPVQATQTLSVNALSHFNLLHACLPHLTTRPNGAHIVTISSVLAHLAPARLADYTASKSAISTLHYSLSYEIATHPSSDVRSKIKTLLVETGQIETGLFADMSLPWYANFFGPVLDAKDVASEIIRVVGRGEGGVVRMPAYARGCRDGLVCRVAGGV